MHYEILDTDVGQGAGAVAVPVTYGKTVERTDICQPYSVAEVLQNVFHADFQTVLENYVRTETEQIQEAGVLPGAEGMKVRLWSYLKTLSKLQQPTDRTVVDVILQSRLEGQYKDGETRYESADFRLRSANEPGQVDCLELVKKLADSYRCLVRRRELLRQQYEESKSWFYTKEEIIYKLSQGAHEESERVQTSGLSNPVERTVLNCDKVLASMNREVQTQRTEQFLEPYYEVCEQIELFEIGLRSLRGQTRLVAEQLFVDGKKQSEITGAEGKLLTRRTVVREKENALIGMADTIGRYQRR